MKVPNLSRFWSFPICAAFALAPSGGVNADDDSAKGKGKGDNPNIVQLDLNKMPPDLAKALQKFAVEGSKSIPESKGKPSESAKEKYEGKSPFNAAHLPPGLAGKAANHPGRVEWLKEQASGKNSAAAPMKDGKAEGDAPAPMKGGRVKGDDLESRLDRLMLEFESLRREIRGKK